MIAMKSRINLRGWVAAVCALPLLASLAWAQPYPNKPVKIVVGYAAGGAVDIVARTAGQRLAGSLGQAVIVENKPGAGTNIAVRSVISAAPEVTPCCSLRTPSWPTWRCINPRRLMPSVTSFRCRS